MAIPWGKILTGAFDLAKVLVDKLRPTSTKGPTTLDPVMRKDKETELNDAARKRVAKDAKP